MTTAGSKRERGATQDGITRRGLARFGIENGFGSEDVCQIFSLRCQESAKKKQNIPETNCFLNGHLFNPTGSCLQSVMREQVLQTDFGHGHCLSEIQLEEILQVISCPTMDSNAFFGSMFLHPCSAGFLPSIVVIVNVRCVALFHSAFFFSGGHDCRYPKAHMQQRSNSLIFVFVLAGLFSYGTFTMSQDARWEQIWY